MAVRTLGKHKFQLIVDYYDEEGKRRKHTKVVECNGKKAARDLLQKYETELEAGFDSDITVSELLKNYIEVKELKGVRKTSIKGYNAYKRRLDQAFGKMKAQDLTALHIERFVIKCVKERGNSPKTIKNIISLLNSAYKMAVRSKVLSDNPCAYVELPKMTRHEILTLSYEEIVKFQSLLDQTDLDFKVLCELALFCGLRRSEILGLTNSDFNFLFGTVRIERTRHRLHQEDIIQETKTERSRRTLYCPAFVLEDVKKLIAEHEIYSDCEFLIQYMGEPLKPFRVTRLVDEFMETNDLPHVTLHGLRHTYATMLNASGEFDFADISAALGHSNITTTMNIYVDVFGGAAHSSRRISDSLEQKFGKNGARNGAKNEKNA